MYLVWMNHWGGSTHTQIYRYRYTDIPQNTVLAVSLKNHKLNILPAPLFSDARKMLVDFTRAETATVQLNTQQQLLDDYQTHCYLGQGKLSWITVEPQVSHFHHIVDKRRATVAQCHGQREQAWPVVITVPRRPCTKHAGRYLPLGATASEGK